MSTTTERRAFVDRMIGRVQSGVATTGCRMVCDGVDVTAEVLDRAGVGGETRVLDREYAWTEPARSGDSSTPTAGTVSAYVHRHGVPVPSSLDASGSPGPRTATTADAWDDWLADVDPREVEFQRNHQGEPVGRWTGFEVDDVGVLGHAEVLNTPGGRRLMADVRAGAVTAFSARTRFGHGDATVERDGDGEYVLIARATLVEAGPQDVAADPGARIVEVDGVPVDCRSPGDVAAEIVGFLGEDRIRELSERREFDARRRTERARERLALCERLAGELKTARVRAARAHASQLDPYGGKASPDELQTAIRAAEDAAARLLDAACNDRSVVAELADRIGIPGAVQQTGRWATLANSIRRGPRR